MHIRKNCKIKQKNTLQKFCFQKPWPITEVDLGDTLPIFGDLKLNEKPVFYQGSKGMTMADKLMYFPNDDTQNFSFWRLQLAVETFGHSTK